VWQTPPAFAASQGTSKQPATNFNAPYRNNATVTLETSRKRPIGESHITAPGFSFPVGGWEQGPDHASKKRVSAGSGHSLTTCLKNIDLSSVQPPVSSGGFLALTALPSNARVSPKTNVGETTEIRHNDPLSQGSPTQALASQQEGAFSYEKYLYEDTLVSGSTTTYFTLHPTETSSISDASRDATDMRQISSSATDRMESEDEE
jgi:hypothetical protein